ncbi:TrbG/VirB9 family P-type conjugative transfer protein [Pectobacterium carotovorum]|uniref:TrbG/VirB9 family P-type conjugative transfer protein n=1 Tax=Pectobacterium carotovorum TaxID=554 RepID=UPI0005079951|nr:TrbG/VirB9 family P-type conjugative transfer protein [Pectobacterium carotovorum]KFW97756.1 conjugal transfer protein [Pectobacterium carotovorum subsp. carotovorum]KML64971.1 conjugal transfer protein [Pectobacterium carotovorum subsp. carotovorum ICMP 5702]SHH69067.1 type IV secretion system protein VirB9 [Pectobacterium carotovorum]
MRFRKELLAIFLTVWLPQADAEISGQGATNDRRIQTALYSPDNIFRIYTMKNRTTIIQLETGETINTDAGAMSLGKPGGEQSPEWVLGANKEGRIIMIKPSSYAEEPETNLIISTNRRTYLFELKLAKNLASTTYLFRFDYPKPPVIGETPFTGRDINKNPCDGTINRQYQKRGDVAISPYSVWDNGTFTCFRFPTNAPRPVIYEVLPDGTESMVNMRPVNDIMVVHGVSQEFRLRLNKMVLAIRSKVNNTGWYNYDGTTTGDIREIKK